MGRLYRECLEEEGCPYSCAHLTRQMDCFSDGCEEGCHCPVGTYQHDGICVQVGASAQGSPFLRAVVGMGALQNAQEGLEHLAGEFEEGAEQDR